ncbi:hypothetical protein, partial [Pseudomonas sp. GP01-A5]|uniref:hypothetical protein n=1 Tax=Pseudomonas sp. GP01-A5 TaxID=2070563 RepID=UPI001C494BC4
MNEEKTVGSEALRLCNGRSQRFRGYLGVGSAPVSAAVGSLHSGIDGISVIGFMNERTERFYDPEQLRT